MKPKVVITQPVHQEVVELLEQKCEVILNNALNTLGCDEILRRAKYADGIMVFMSDRVDDKFLQLCPKLKIVAAALKGYDNFDVKSCTRRGVWFTTVPDLLTAPTAELTVGLLIALSRNMSNGDRFIRTSRFNGWRPNFYGTGLSGRNLGIVGMGALGQAIAKRLSSFDMSISYADPIPVTEQKEVSWGMNFVSLDQVLSKSDFVILAVPLTPATFHLIDQSALEKIKTGAFLVNTCRGSVVDEEAVIRALSSGKLAGYAADVFETEDWARPDRPNSIPDALISMTSATFFTPHLGSAVDDVRLEIELEAAHNILQAFEGKRPTGAINDIANIKVTSSNRR
jgi:phosphonate dehydrogenase